MLLQIFVTIAAPIVVGVVLE
ncbi:type I toxin-antitoxin system Fst family toxin [Lactococcus lactis]|nr:type I toxin-antitoxin system Fst family toxin [Lactococcus lactis]